MTNNYSYILIDDDPIANVIHRKILNSYTPDIDIFNFTEPQRALDFLYLSRTPCSEYKYIIFLDLNMPEMSGWKFIEELKKEKPQVTLSIYLLTSSIAPEERKKANNCHMINGFITKPLFKSHLEDIFKESQDKEFIVID